MRKRIKLLKRYCVYIDSTTEQDPRIFYVGKGTEDRVNLLERNELHTRIINKYGQIRSVLFETDDENIALNIEINLIDKYKTFAHGGDGWWGANLTRGGEGTSGHICSVEQREKISRSNKEAHNANPELRKEISRRQKQLMSDPDHLKKMSLALKRSYQKMSSEKRSAMSKKLSLSNMGRISPVRGSKSPRTTLNEHVVRIIKQDFLEMMKHHEKNVKNVFTLICNSLASSSQVTYQTIYKIVRGKTWKHVKVSYKDVTI